VVTGRKDEYLVQASGRDESRQTGPSVQAPDVWVGTRVRRVSLSPRNESQ